MADETHASIPDRYRSGRSERAGCVTLGLIPAPDIPETMARDLAPQLPKLLENRVDGDVSWEVPVVVEPLTGTDREAPEILDVCRERRLGEGWDLAICLTDLPVYRDGTLVAADVSAKRGVAGLSLPAMGAMRLRPKARDLTLQLAGELYERTKERGTDDLPDLGTQPKGSLGSFRRVDPSDEDMKAMDVDARFAAPGALGHLRLWSGMVLANRPWKMLPAFKGAIAAAFATGAYVLAISSMWLLADAVGLWRLLALMFVAAWVFVPGDYFQSTLKHPARLGEYLTLAWLGTSLATVAGALGASLEDEERVRAASYGYRQRRRHEDDDSEEES